MLYKKYYPKDFDDILYNDNIKKIFKMFIKYNKVKNIILTGHDGCGKSTLLKIFLKKIKGYKIMEISTNDLKTNMNILMEKVKLYGEKIIFLDNCTLLDINQQNNLNILLNEGIKCNFIICTNNLDNIKETLKQKFLLLNYQKVPEEILFEYFSNICKQESIDISDKKLEKIIKYSNNDFRKIINNISIYEDIDFTFYDRIENIMKSTDIKEKLEIAEELYDEGYTCSDILSIINISVQDKYDNNEYDIEKFNEIIKNIIDIQIRISEGLDTITQLYALINIIS